MRTLTELAETYEQWAAEAETLADQIMAGLNTQRKEIHVKQLESAQMFVGEAERLRQAAARLRAAGGLSLLFAKQKMWPARADSEISARCD
jgi:hypothetical protein